MSRQSNRAIFAAMMMILASLAGCLGSDTEDEDRDVVIASTYHVGQLASAVGGGLVDVEMMSTMNVPVHDYEPSAQDLIRLSNADVFLYHGLGLEPWVDGAVANIGSGGPAVYATHAMPGDEATLDFETILINNLCSSMTEPATTDVHVLAEHPREAEELHGDNAGHNFAFPVHNESDNETHSHNETNSDNETEHDHAEHDEVSPEETIANPEGCAAGTAINVYHFEAGEYMLEFESESQDPFRMAIAAMGGAHHHHHGDEHAGVCHDEDTHENHDEYTTEEDCEAAGHHWMEGGEAKEGGVCHDTTTHENHDEYTTEEDCEAAGHHWMEGGEEAEGECHDEVTEEKHSEFTTKEDCEAAGHHWEDGWDDAYEEGAAFIGLHVEEEGDYGIALPAGVALHVLETGHDDHDHGGEEVFEWAGVFEMSDATHTWSMQKVDGAYADPSMWLVLIPTETHTEDTIHDLEDGVDALVDAGCTVVEDGETMANIASNGTCFELHVGTGDDSTYTIDTAGITNMAMFAQHVPIEFERDQHYLKDAAGEDIEPKAEEGAEGHAHAHGDEEIAFDPHSWLDPLAFSAQVEVVYTALSKAFPEHAEDFRSNADAYKAQLADLDEGFESAFGDSGTCSTNTVAANHNAYAYISQRYGVEFVNLHGLDPEGEPSPEAVAEVLERVEEDGITAIYVEEYSPNGALDSLIQQTVSDDLPNGLAVLTLYTMETAPSDSSDNYITLMTKNLDNLKVGLGC